MKSNGEKGTGNRELSIREKASQLREGRERERETNR